MTYKVLSTDKVSEEGLAPLIDDDRFDVVRIDDSGTEEFESVLVEAAGLIVRSATKVDEDLLSRAEMLKAVGRAGVGVDNIDIRAAAARGIPVFNAPGGNTTAAAELTMALMLSLARRVTAADRSMREGRWDRAAFKGIELKGRTLGIIGAGRIGAEVASRAKAFGMNLLVYDPYLPLERAAELPVRVVTNFDTLLTESDVITCHVPLSGDTRGLIDAEAISKMKEGVFLINASRGGVIAEDALVDALTERRIAGAALDVYVNEPLPEDSPLRRAPNLLHTPHLGASTVEAQVGVAAEVAEAIRGALADDDASRAVNAHYLG